MSDASFPDGMQVFERGWLSSNCILFEDDAGSTLIDSGYVTHAEQTLAMVLHALESHRNPKLRRVINTHLHSDHCGGNAALQARGGVETWIPTHSVAAVEQWDEDALSYRFTDQPCPRFAADRALVPG